MLMFKEVKQNFTGSNLLGHTGNKNLKMISTLIFMLFLIVLPSFLTSVHIKLYTKQLTRIPQT